MEALALLATILFGSLLQSAFSVVFGRRAPLREGKIDQALEDRYLRFSAEISERDGAQTECASG